ARHAVDDRDVRKRLTRAVPGDRCRLHGAEGAADLRRLRVLERAEALAHVERRQADGIHRARQRARLVLPHRRAEGCRHQAAGDGKNGAVIGNWNYAIPKDISAARRKAALAFAKWFVSYDAQYAYAKAGGIPNRSDVLASDLARDPAYRWMPAYAETLKTAKQELGYQEGPQVEPVLGLRLNQAVI